MNPASIRVTGDTIWYLCCTRIYDGVSGQSFAQSSFS